MYALFGFAQVYNPHCVLKVGEYQKAEKKKVQWLMLSNKEIFL